MLARSPVHAVSLGAEQMRASVLRLDLAHFRNYRSARLETDGRPVVLTGANGAGKTNLLEAISFLAPGRGLRRARLSEVDCRLGEGATSCWAVSARISTASGIVAVGTGREAVSEQSDRRVVRIEGQTAKSQTALAQHLNLVWLTPQMDRLFQEGAAPRRRFLDRLVFGFDPDHASRLASYDQAMKERSRLLRAGHADPAWLSVLEDRMARDGVAIAAARRDIAQRLDEAASDPVDAAHFPVARIGLEGPAEGWLTDMPALAAEERLKTEYAATRRLDGETGGTSVGAHRADLVVRHAGKNQAAPACSTGEQKALLISIVLAHARLQTGLRGVAPILLLDEIAAHLDRPRRAALFDRLLSLGSQAWLTGTEPETFEFLGENAHFFTVGDGQFNAGPEP